MVVNHQVFGLDICMYQNLPSVIYLLKMVISHSYVILPGGFSPIPIFWGNNFFSSFGEHEIETALARFGFDQVTWHVGRPDELEDLTWEFHPRHEADD